MNKKYTFIGDTIFKNGKPYFYITAESCKGNSSWDIAEKLAELLNNQEVINDKNIHTRNQAQI
jgi:hypothetical protein